MLIGFVDQAVSQNFALYIDKDVGLGPAVAGSAVSTAAFISIFGKVGFGWVYDKLSTKGVMLCYVLMAVSVLIAIPVHGPVLLGALVLTRGLAHGGAIVDIPVMSKHCFGPKVLGRTIGVLTACVTVGFATGPPVMGYNLRHARELPLRLHASCRDEHRRGRGGSRRPTGLLGREH